VIVASQRLIVIGASTGGTEAIKTILMQMPPDCPGILVAQHMPQSFTNAFVQRLNGACRIRVVEAEGGERVRTGHAYVAPGHSHLRVACDGASFVTELSAAAAVNRHRPSVDVLFRSAAKCAGSKSIGVLLTGMGKDGAAGMLAMQRAGAATIAQDEASCVVFGMPKEAIALGAVDEVMPLAEIAKRVLFLLAGRGRRPRAAV
jgi:two-component system chemotaxis response regulator CheB